MEAKGGFLLSLLAEIIEEDRLRIYELEAIVTQMIEVSGFAQTHPGPAHSFPANSCSFAACPP
jgi:hypothetical protein